MAKTINKLPKSLFKIRNAWALAADADVGGVLFIGRK